MSHYFAFLDMVKAKWNFKKNSTKKFFQALLQYTENKL